MSLLDLFKTQEQGTGALLDYRPESLKEKDYKFEELVASAAPVTWVEKKPENYRKFPIYNQNGSGSCVAQTAAKLLGISYFLKNKEYVHFSATDIYQQRVNKPNGGMGGADVFKIIGANGATLEELAPSQKMTDSQMDSIVIPEYKREVGRVFKVSNYLTIPAGNLEQVASVIQQTGKGVMVWFYFVSKEWTATPTIIDPSLTSGSPRALRHSVTAVDFTLIKGKKYLIIEDSWGPSHGIGGQRLISEDFFNKRNFYAGYLMNFNFDSKPAQKPVARFRVPMEYSPTFKIVEDVKKLQDILKYEGLFPQNVESTGYYGAVTAKSVLEFQLKYAVASETELKALGGKVCGGSTLDKLNKLYQG
jgi:hypothetical protein